MHFKSNPSDFKLKNGLKIAEPRIDMHDKVNEDSLLVANDVNNDGFLQKNLGKTPKPADATTALLLRESVVEHKEPIEEVDSDRLPSIASREQSCTHHEKHELLEVATSGTKTETLMAEMVSIDTLQSLEEHADFATSLSPKSSGKFGQVTEVRMKEDDQRENTRPSQTKTRSLSSRTLEGSSQNRLG